MESVIIPSSSKPTPGFSGLFVPPKDKQQTVDVKNESTAHKAKGENTNNAPKSFQRYSLLVNNSTLSGSIFDGTATTKLKEEHSAAASRLSKDGRKSRRLSVKMFMKDLKHHFTLKESLEDYNFIVEALANLSCPG